MLGSVVPGNLYRVILPIFVTVFYITPYLDTVLSAFSIVQCFKTD